ncbi:Cytochrome B561 [Paramagnetospirillum magnetotacticum MS-1]|uniref:Cytochrome B561 n=1 Tax=Paramagnetospirillum magnetotacticum MS-1 TaxID=272627 RepID=A0A0C2YBN1_PARME|nr:cytochrome b [Paramagnetospirillum magnetotacticum]KIL97119.1 Cytochrome B561 [Paramagnetospirillum magnetotacticum MS-1]
MNVTAPARYDAVAKSLHWVMAAGILALWVVGHMIDVIPKGPQRSEVIGLHKAIGCIMLVLAVARLAWRLAKPQPALPPSMSPAERMLAWAGHVALYLMMVLIPVDGILMSQTAGRDVSVFGLVLPKLLAKNEALNGVFKEGHEVLGWVLAVILIGHIAAALRHRFILKDDIMARMLPGRTPL